ncbi:MAG: anthranilate synthase component I family protein, partial [Desulfuromonadales bacterium]|nr:anthranilate synthase component I family protein [Desulfuromonadales bacterium]NIS41101.1 anthranilate synthase component I family protein [Desulfuromonadales bacterium]
KLVRITDGEEELLSGDPFAILGDLLASRAIDPRKQSPFPGGFFGFFAYDLA